MNQPTTMPEIEPGLIPVIAVKYSHIIRKDLAQIAPELPEITRLAAREAEILEAASEFTPQKAKDDFDRETAALRADPKPLNIQKLKSVGSLDQRRAAYEGQHHALTSEAGKIYKSAAPAIEAISARLCHRLAELREQAAEEEAEVFHKWGLPVPASRSADHFTRAQQELRSHIDGFARHYYPGTLGGWIKRFLDA